MIPVSYQEFSARKWPLFLIFVPLILILLTFNPEDNKSRSSINLLLTGLSAIFTIFYFVISKLKLIIDNEGIETKMLFKTERVRWAEITKSNLSFEFHAHSGDVKWVFNTSDGKSLSFSPTYFVRKDLQQVAEALRTKSVEANISDKVRRMSEGKFPWYIF